MVMFSLKINKRRWGVGGSGGSNKVRGGREKIEKLISRGRGGGRLLGTSVENRTYCANGP